MLILKINFKNINIFLNKNIFLKNHHAAKSANQLTRVN